ncbi:MAG: HTTM domain-containing protein [Myxococcota bacterium]
MRDALDRQLTALARAEGSTRPVALVRIGLALLLWSRFADELQPFTALGPAWLALGAAFYGATTWMLLGYRARLATAATAVVVWIMVFAVGRSGAMFSWTHHHTTLLAYAVALLALTPCGGSLSLDRWLAVRAAERAGTAPPPERGPLWAVPLLGVLLSTVYFWGAIDKCTVGFLSGARLELIWMDVYAGSDFVPTGPVHLAFAAASIAVTALEFVLAFGLWVGRWQRWLVPVGLATHAAFYLLLPQVYTFSCTMALLYLAFLDPGAVSRTLDRLL